MPVTLSKHEIAEIEAAIVHDSVEAAIRASHGLDVGEIFHSNIVGMNRHPERFAPSVHSVIVNAIAEQVQPFGLRLSHDHAVSCDFYVHYRRY